MNSAFVTRTGAIKRKASFSFMMHQVAILLYLLKGKKKATKGHGAYLKRFLNKVVYNEELLNIFRTNQKLPQNYGLYLTERVVEYPWMLSRLSLQSSTILDAGSTLNFEYLLNHAYLSEKQVVIYTLSPAGENRIVRPNVSYIYGDLRQTILNNDTFDEIVCISTIEHVGMDNTLLYTKDNVYREKKSNDFELTIKELKRLLKPQGKLLLTVPYGRFQDIGWLQQFNNSMVTRLIKIFDGTACAVTYYKYYSSGWQWATEEECADAEYHDPAATKTAALDGAVAARAVACIELIK